MASWRDGVKRILHSLWAAISFLVALAALYGATDCYDEYGLTESPLGQIGQAGHGTTVANLWLFGATLCLAATAGAVWNGIVQYRATGSPRR